MAQDKCERCSGQLKEFKKVKKVYHSQVFWQFKHCNHSGARRCENFVLAKYKKISTPKISSLSHLIMLEHTNTQVLCQNNHLVNYPHKHSWSCLEHKHFRVKSDVYQGWEDCPIRSVHWQKS